MRSVNATSACSCVTKVAAKDRPTPRVRPSRDCPRRAPVAHGVSSAPPVTGSLGTDSPVPDMTPTKPRRRRKGFTLIELIVVIAVLAMLAALVAPNVFRHVGSARDTTARAQIEMLGAALDAYRLDTGRYPTTSEGLAALTTAPTTTRPGAWRGPYLRKAVPVDPWTRPYAYKSPGEANPTGYDLASLGADGTAGGDGENADITSWK